MIILCNKEQMFYTVWIVITSRQKTIIKTSSTSSVNNLDLEMFVEFFKIGQIFLRNKVSRQINWYKNMHHFYNYLMQGWGGGQSSPPQIDFLNPLGGQQKGTA